MAKTTSTPAPLPQIKAAGLRTWHQRLLTWYRTHGRHELPWRQTDDPYKIWLSEVMLQQTQVSTVLARFYHPFLKTFPTVQSLADAPREKVLKAWEGLGYYRRAGFLHEAAKQVINQSLRAQRSNPAGGVTDKPGLPRCARNDGDREMPNTIEGLRALPGIGKNTAHAIAAFAYRQPVAIMEANVKRIVARIFALEHPKDDQLWAGAEMLLNHKDPFGHNQAMMDLGSLVCTPKNPHCTICPANAICAGKHAPANYPAAKIKKATPVRHYSILVLEDEDGRLHLEARGDALLGGLYGFPQVPRTTDLRYPMREMHIAPDDWKEIGEVVHIYSHFRLEARIIHGRLRRRMNSPSWHTQAEIHALPLSGLDRKVLALVDVGHTAATKRSKKPA